MRTKKKTGPKILVTNHLLVQHSVLCPSLVQHAHHLIDLLLLLRHLCVAFRLTVARQANAPLPSVSPWLFQNNAPATMIDDNTGIMQLAVLITLNCIACVLISTPSDDELHQCPCSRYPQASNQKGCSQCLLANADSKYNFRDTRQWSFQQDTQSDYQVKVKQQHV